MVTIKCKECDRYSYVDLVAHCFFCGSNKVNVLPENREPIDKSIENISKGFDKIIAHIDEMRKLIKEI